MPISLSATLNLAPAKGRKCSARREAEMADDHDLPARLAAFDFLEEQTQRHGDALPRATLEKGFVHDGRRIPLLGPQGIFKPATMELPLSLTTAPVVGGRPRPLRRRDHKGRSHCLPLPRFRALAQRQRGAATRDGGPYASGLLLRLGAWTVRSSVAVFRRCRRSLVSDFHNRRRRTSYPYWDDERCGCGADSTQVRNRATASSPSPSGVPPAGCTRLSPGLRNLQAQARRAP